MTPQRARELYDKCMAVATSNGPQGERDAAFSAARKLVNKFGSLDEQPETAPNDLRDPSRGPISQPTDLQMEQNFWRAFHRSGGAGPECRCESCRKKDWYAKPARRVMTEDDIMASIRAQHMEEMADEGLLDPKFDLEAWRKENEKRK